MKYLLLSLLSFTATVLSLTAQNLVPNPGFEQYQQLPCQMIHSREQFQKALLHWQLPSRGTADIWSTLVDPSCWAYALGNSYFDMRHATAAFGVQLPHSGEVMAGLALYLPERNYREYLQVELLQPLEKGKQYHISFWVARAGQVRFACNNLGVCLLDQPVNDSGDEVLGQLSPDFSHEEIIDTKGPQDWLQISQIITARSEARYLLIGNFFNNKKTRVEQVLDLETKKDYFKNSAYYFIDDVMLKPLDSLPEKSEPLLVQQPEAVPDTLSTFEQVPLGQLVELKNIFFAYNKARLLPASYPELDKLLQLLRTRTEAGVEIYGHTDDTGNQAYNQQLSELRAGAVKDYLVAKGIDQNRIRVSGYGASRPVASNATAAGRARNRRVEFKLTAQ